MVHIIYSCVAVNECNTNVDLTDLFAIVCVRYRS